MNDIDKACAISNVLKQQWKDLATLARESSVPEYQSIFGQCAMTVCSTARSIENATGWHFEWLPR